MFQSFAGTKGFLNGRFGGDSGPLQLLFDGGSFTLLGEQLIRNSFQLTGPFRDNLFQKFALFPSFFNGGFGGAFRLIQLLFNCAALSLYGLQLLRNFFQLL